MSQYGKFLPNATTSSYPNYNVNINDELNSNWSKGVIFINEDSQRFFSLSSEKQKTTITHEVGHALKLCHSNNKIDSSESMFSPASIMRNSNGTISNSITLYDKSSLIKKWS